MAISGWTRHPLVGYDLVEDHGDWTSPEGRPIGTITSGHHFDAWTKPGMKLGTFDDIIVETEGDHSSGHAHIAVGQDVVRSPTPCDEIHQSGANRRPQPNTASRPRL
ncbi:glycoside hydrolase family 11 protein [Oleiagrimonas sp. C23AA]|nr:glycoside hydrolase family 11 protein [Oleiagrimonas sp. C23AA]